MCLNPAMGAEIHGDAGAKQAERDGQRSGDPAHIDAPFEDEEVQDAKDNHEHSRLSKEGGAATRGDYRQIEQWRRLTGGLPLWKHHQTEASRVLGWVTELRRNGGGWICCIFVKHKRGLVKLS